MRAHGITRRGDGSFRVRLGQHERELLRHLPGQVREIILGNDPTTYRLFPPAHLDDAAADADYRQLVGEGLLDEKLAAIAVFEQTAGLDRLDEQQLYAWLGAIESLRLVLGTLLDVTEETYGRELDSNHPDSPRFALYGWLSWLQEETVLALSSTLPADRGSRE